MTYRNVVGPEHMDLFSLIPWHKKLDQVVQLWQEFTMIMDMMKCDLVESELKSFQTKAQSWVTLYKDTHLARDVKLYIGHSTRLGHDL